MKLHAIKENFLYLRTFKKGDRCGGRFVTVYVMKDYFAERLARANPEKKQINRVGLSVTKKVGGAVQRNRAKRIIREGYRAFCRTHPIKLGHLIVISAKPTIADRKSGDIEKDLSFCLAKLNMLQKAKENKPK